MKMRRHDWAATALVALAPLATGCGGEGSAIGPGGENGSGMPDYAVVAAAGTLVTFRPEADTYISSQSPSTNFGTAPDLEIGGTTNQRIAYLRFNVSGLPAGAQVTDARLTMVASNASSQSGGTIRKYAPTSPTWRSSRTRSACAG